MPRPPNVPLLRAIWSLLDGIWGLLKGSGGGPGRHGLGLTTGRRERAKPGESPGA